MVVMKNKIPEILHQRRMNITDLHDLLTRGDGTKMSYPTVHKLATEEEIPNKTTVLSLAKVAVVLDLTPNDLIDLSIVSTTG